VGLRGDFMATTEELVDTRMKLRIERLEREKEKQNLKHQQKIENRDWFSELNKGGDYGRRTERN
jgi:hypothetical protein